MKKQAKKQKQALLMNEDLEPTEYGRIISALVIGIGTALKEKTTTLDEAEQYLFNPHMMDVLEKVGVPNGSFI